MAAGVVGMLADRDRGRPGAAHDTAVDLEFASQASHFTDNAVLDHLHPPGGAQGASPLVREW